MRIRLSNTQFFDAQGVPLDGGRVSVYLNDSDTLATLYEVAGEDYVQTANPQTCGVGGFIPSVYFDAALVSVKVEKANGDGTYSVVDTYTDGFAVDAGSNPEGIIEGLAGLKDVAPENGMVVQVHMNGLVLNYVYDENSTDTADDGVVVASDHGNGRWILLYDCDSLPCTVYGITPGNEANINAFLQFPDYVGTWSIRTPPKCRFLGGTYTTNSVLSCLKPIVFDIGAQFLYANFNVTAIEAMTNNGKYIADFTFSKNGMTAHSSWFKSVRAFWACNAQKFVIDKYDYFVNKGVSGTVSVSNAIVEGLGKRIDATYTSGSCVKFTNCTIVGQKMFSPLNDSLWFYGMEIREEWFNNHQTYNYDFGTIAQGHRLDIRTGQQNIVKFDNFTTPDIYLKACIADPSVTVFDGHGASFGGGLLAANNYFTAINNMNYSGDIDDLGCDDWNNVNVSGALTFSGSGRLVNMTGCSFSIGGTTDSVSQLVLKDCIVNGGTLNPNATALLCNGGEWRANIELSDTAKANYTKNKTVYFHKCSVMPSGYLWLNDITMVDCVSTAHIYLVPYDDSGYEISGVFERNRFTGSALIEANVKDPSTETGVYDVAVALRILDNVWEQSGNGIYIPYRTLDFNNYFVALGSEGNSKYKGNVGNCPLEKHDLTAFDASAMTNTYGSGSGAFHYLGSASNRRVWNLNPAIAWSVAFGNLYESGSNPNPVNGVGSAMYLDYLIHIGQTDYLEEHNDQFLVTHAWEEQQGYNVAKSVAVFQ